MLMIPGNARLFLCQHSVSMHKSFEGLSAEIEQLFPGELLSGAFFIFLNRHRDHMKVLFWDKDGLVIWYKRLGATRGCDEKLSSAWEDLLYSKMNLGAWIKSGSDKAAKDVNPGDKSQGKPPPDSHKSR